MQCESEGEVASWTRNGENKVSVSKVQGWRWYPTNNGDRRVVIYAIQHDFDEARV